MRRQVLRSSKQEEMLCSRSNHGCVNPDPLPVRNLHMCNAELTIKLYEMLTWLNAYSQVGSLYCVAAYLQYKTISLQLEVKSSPAVQDLYDCFQPHISMWSLNSFCRRSGETFYLVLAAAHTWGRGAQILLDNTLKARCTLQEVNQIPLRPAHTKDYNLG